MTPAEIERDDTIGAACIRELSQMPGDKSVVQARAIGAAMALLRRAGYPQSVQALQEVGMRPTYVPTNGPVCDCTECSERSVNRG